MGVLLRWQQPPSESSWDQTEIEYSADQITWSDLTTITDITETSYYDEEGTSSRYYRMRFYNSSTAVYAPWSTAVLGDEVGGYCTVQELRKFIQFASSNNPSSEDMSFLIEQSKEKLDNDIAGTESDATKKLLHLNLGASFVFKSLASRALRAGYVEMNVEGRTVRKPYKELLEIAKSYMNDYLEELQKSQTEVDMTSPLRTLDTDTQQDIIDIFHGTTNGEDFEDRLSNSEIRRRD